MRLKKPDLSRLRAYLPLLCVLLCALQPLMDVLSYWQTELGGRYSFALILRIGTIACMLLVALPFVCRKRQLATLLILFLLYLTGHVFACVKVSPAYAWREDLADQLRLLTLPVTVFCMTVFLRENEMVFFALKKGLMLAFGLILAVMVLSVLSGTDPHTYASKQIGIRGWFFWTSAQSAILSMLCPLAIAWVLLRYPEKPAYLLIVCLLIFGALYAYGTRLSYASLAASGVCMAGSILYADGRRRASAWIIFLCAAAFLALYPISPMTRNRTELHENAEIKQSRIDAAAAATAEQYDLDLGEANTASDLRVLAAAYHYCLQGMVDRFGIERVAAAYEGSTDVSRIWDERVRKLRFCQLLMEDAAEITPLARIFGLEIGTTRVEETDVYVFETDEWERQSEASDPENDFYGVYYLCGIAGLGLLVLFLTFFVVRVFRVLCREPKRALMPENAAFLIAFGIALVYAWNTVSVIRRNNASFYFAVVLACIGHLYRGQEMGRPQPVIGVEHPAR